MCHRNIVQFKHARKSAHRTFINQSNPQMRLLLKIQLILTLLIVGGLMIMFVVQLIRKKSGSYWYLVGAIFVAFLAGMLAW
jgi:hypothetical protein